MSVGFRKSFFGFNCDDVISYIENTHKKFSKKEKEYRQDIDALKEDVALKEKELATLTDEKAVIESQLKEYTDKYDEIERLSQNIGKLYLVAEANANAIMKNTAENSEIANNEVEKNITSIDEAHRSLEALKEKILKTSDDFALQVDSLIASLNETKGHIEGNIQDSNSKIESYENLFAEISK